MVGDREGGESGGGGRKREGRISDSERLVILTGGVRVISFIMLLRGYQGRYCLFTRVYVYVLHCFIISLCYEIWHMWMWTTSVFNVFFFHDYSLCGLM